MFLYSFGHCSSYLCLNLGLTFLSKIGFNQFLSFLSRELFLRKSLNVLCIFHSYLFISYTILSKETFPHYPTYCYPVTLYYFFQNIFPSVNLYYLLLYMHPGWISLLECKLSLSKNLIYLFSLSPGIHVLVVE